MVASKDSSATRITKSNIRLVRFLTSVLSYMFILACSGMIIYFANKRGNPDALKVLYYIAFALNIAQIGLVIAKFVISQLGIFDRFLYKIEEQHLQSPLFSASKETPSRLSRRDRALCQGI